MGRTAVITLCFLASLPLFFGFPVYAGPDGNPEISFSFPFDCKTGDGKRTRCLTDAFKLGRSVALLDKTGICGARTADTFKFDNMNDNLEATRLTGTDECFAAKDDEGLFTGFRIAIVGVDPAVVRLISVEKEASPITKEIELKARELAAPRIEEPQKVSDGSRVPVGLSDAPPKVIRTENVTLLTFELQAQGEPWEPGPIVLLMDDKMFLLEGACTYGKPILFSVNGRLHLTYHSTVHCCGCGDSNSFVYDLSSGTPKKVYQDSTFAN